MPDSNIPVVVILVDNKVRDLPVATLLAHHLQQNGVRPVLQPLESYQGVLAAFEPAMILFNHLTASHLMKYSLRLKELGVIVGVLPNEGIAYDPDDLKFLSGQFHSGAHIDHFFAWNEPHKAALIECDLSGDTQIHVIGVPRFDFYFEPYSKLMNRDSQQYGSIHRKPLVLICTNFVYAKFEDSPGEAKKFFGTWTRMDKYDNPVEFVHIHTRERARFMEHLKALVASGDFHILLRPHPLEYDTIYRNWVAGLPDDRRANVSLDSTTNIKNLILQCDVEVACETCTTTLESWMAGKPTVELVFERNDSLFHEDLAALNVTCEEPTLFVHAVKEALRNNPSDAVKRGRLAHLKKWCDTPRGDSTEKIAKVITNAVTNISNCTPLRLTATDRRRGWKLRALNALNLAYHFDPLLPIKSVFNPERYGIKRATYQKSIKPSDVQVAHRSLSMAIRTAASFSGK